MTHIFIKDNGFKKYLNESGCFIRGKGFAYAFPDDLAKYIYIALNYLPSLSGYIIEHEQAD